MAFFDIRIFHPNAKRYDAQSLQRYYINNKEEKKRQYNMRVLQVGNGSLTPLVFSIIGGMGRKASKCYLQITEMLSKKRGKFTS